METKGSNKDWIKFLGTAGARFVVAKQLRSSGGIWLSLKGVNLYLDPGPGALVRCLTSKPKLNPMNLDGIILSHKHLDHAGDINALIEAMTEGGYRQRGILFAPRDALEEDPVVFHYVRSYLDKIEVLQENREYVIKDLRFTTAQRHIHAVETYGFNFCLGNQTISFITDTKFYPQLISQYPGEVLVVNVVLLTEPEHPIEHLSLEDVQNILKNGRARVVVLTHFGMRMLQARPWEIAEKLSQETGRKVIAARDGMILQLDELLTN
ncbi:MAG: MBL fold metallo-hydrolase [Thermodesulfobacteriota bacterium]